MKGGQEIIPARFFDYYYGRESEQFTFFRIPKLPVTDPYFSFLSAEAKLLYGLLMDRMNLSRMNAWYDDQGRVFIMYPIREIQNDLCVGKNTACKLFKQMESVGLVERVRRGLGLPDLIYVKNFASGERPGEPEYDLEDPNLTSPSQIENESASESTDGRGSIWNVHGKSFPRSVERKSSIRSTDRRRSSPSADRENLGRSGDWKSSLKSKPLAAPDLTCQRFKNQTSGVPKSGTLKNKNDINNNYNNKSSSFLLPPSSAETGSAKIDDEETGREETEEETKAAAKTPGDTSDYSAGLSYPELVKAVKEKIDYDVLVSDYGEREVSIFPQLIAEMLYKCRDGRQIVVGSNTYHPEILKARYLEVDLQHIRHIMFLMQEEHISPRVVRNYYVQALYDAPVTMDAYYARRVDHDMNCGWLAAGA